MSIGTLPTDEIMQDYLDAFWAVYGQEARILFLGNQWYQVNGQPVHRTVIQGEIERLRDLAELQRMNNNRPQLQKTQKSAVQRLISKLRRL
jgi:hypothetical protein